MWWGETLGSQHTGGGSDLGGRGSCPLREVSTGQGGRWGDVVGGLLSTEEGVDRLRSWQLLSHIICYTESASRSLCYGRNLAEIYLPIFA